MNFTLYNVPSQALNWLIPKRCLQCSNAVDSPNDSVCTHCYPELPFQDHYCSRCGQSFAANTDYCGRCISSPPSFDSCFCPFKYEKSIKELICDLKYRERPELAKSAATLLAKELLENNVTLPEALISVPVHISRLRERGYNHSALIAQNLSKALGVPALKRAIRKSKQTAPQATQSLKQRKKNLLGSFELNKNIQAKSVAIVDDVVTTGSTAEEIAKILKTNGVDYIQVWGVAHTL